MDPSHTYANAGVYTVTLTVTSSAGCMADAQVQVNASVGVNETDMKASWSVFPNPAVNDVQLVSHYAGWLNVIDPTGKLLVHNLFIAPGAIHRIDSSGWSEGIYQLVLQTEMGTDAFRLVKVN
jgi:hypothetical protein